MTDHHDPEDRQNEVLTAVLKFLGITVGVGVLILVVSLFVVSRLDLNEPNGPITSIDSFTPPSQLPTVAITATPTATPTPTPTPTPTEEPSDLPTETPDPASVGEDGLMLTATPTFVKAGKRIDLIGSWPGKDNVSVRVQRFEDGEWTDFGVTASVRIGSFATYVLTSRGGENRFRVYDPSSDTASNDVTVTVED